MAFREKVLHLRFNQNHGCFICCLESGVRVYNVEPLTEMAHLDAKEYGTMCIGEMLNRTNLLALVGGGPSPKYADNTVLIYDDDVEKFIIEYTYATSVLAIRLCNTKLIVALKNSIHVFSFPNQTELVFSIRTRNNPRGLLEFTPSMNCHRNIMCFPAENVGTVQIIDLALIHSKVSASPCHIYAHKTELACLSLNQDGSLLATASIQGTLVRVFDTANRIQVAEFRRGADQANICCINFSGDNDYLCCSSDKGTVHVFALKNSSLNRRSTFSGITVFGGYVESQWDLANFPLPPETASICTFGSSYSIYALCFDGTFHKYIFRSDGSCSRVAFDSFQDLCNHWFC